MLSSVRYASQGNNFIWPIPFPYGSNGDVGVTLADSVGRERRLSQGSDYVVQDGNVVCVVPDGHWLTIFQDGAADLSANASRVMAQAQPVAIAGQAAAAAVEPAASAESDRMTSLEAKLDALLAARTQSGDARIEQLQARLDQLLADQQQARTLALEQARLNAQDEQLAKLASQGEKLSGEIDNKAELACETIELAAGQCEDKLNAQAASLLVYTSEAQEVAQQVRQAAGQARQAGEDLQSRSEEAAQAIASQAQEAGQSLKALTDAGVATVSNVTAAGVNEVNAAAARASREAAIASRLAGQAWPTQGSQVLAADLAAGSVMALPEPLRYYPGRNCLFLALNGYVLTPGRDFEEVGGGANLSNTIRFLIAVHSGDILNIWIAPSNQAQAASQYADKAAASAYEAASSASHAANALGNVQSVADKAVTEGAAKLSAIQTQGSQAVKNVALCRDNALDEIRSAGQATRKDCVNVWQTAAGEIRKEGETSSQAARELWRKAELGIAEIRQDAQQKAEAAASQADRGATRSGQSAASAHELAQCAWRAAFQASLDRAMPGIGTVRCLADLYMRPSGIYFINAQVREPLPFMGVYPVTSLAETRGQDGVFLIGGTPWPDDYTPPDLPYPEHPEEHPDMQPQAVVNHWLPCDHTHN